MDPRRRRRSDLSPLCAAWAQTYDVWAEGSSSGGSSRPAAQYVSTVRPATAAMSWKSRSRVTSEWPPSAATLAIITSAWLFGRPARKSSVWISAALLALRSSKGRIVNRDAELPALLPTPPSGDACNHHIRVAFRSARAQELRLDFRSPPRAPLIEGEDRVPGPGPREHLRPLP